MKPAITLVSPNGGEHFDQGDTITVQWNTSNFGNLNVGLTVLSRRNADDEYDVYENFAINIPNTGSYRWTIPSTYPDGEYQMIASSQDKGPSAQDVIDNFFVIGTAPTTPTITSFTADMAASGSPIDIQWRASAPTEAAIDFICLTDSYEFDINGVGGLDATVACAKGGLEYYANESSGTTSFNLQGNSEPVTISFILSILDDGYPAVETRTITLTIPAQSAAAASSGSLQGIYQTENAIFNKALRLGLESDDVRRLQVILANDAVLYPQGIVTGYYGLLTQAAVQRFQLIHIFPTGAM